MEFLKRVISEKPYLSLATLFAASRALLYPLFPFRVDFLPWLNQLLDINLLREDLWGSIAEIHMTPPLYNVFVGAIVQLPEAWWPFVFQSLFFLMGLAMVLMTYRILIFLKAPQWLAFLGGFAILANPILFRFEIIPFYTYPLAFLLLLSVFFLIRFLEAERKSDIAYFLGVILTIVLFRNFFHAIFFFVPIAVGLCIFVYTTRKSLFAFTLAVSAAFLVLGLIPSIKNQVEYGIFASSTWQGMQFFSMTHFVPEEKVKALIDEGKATPLALLPRFQNPDIYYEYYNKTPREGNPAVNALYKSAGEYEFGNFNNWIYAKTAKEYGENTIAIMSRYPEFFLPRLVNSVYIFFGLANYRYFDQTDEWLVFDGHTLKQAFQATKYFVQPTVLALIFLSILWSAGRKLWSERNSITSNENAALIFLLFLLLYTFGVANIVELGENYTARVPIDPLITILAFYCGYLVFRSKPVETPGLPG